VSIPDELLLEVSLVAIEMPLSVLAQRLAEQTGLVVAIDPKFHNAIVTADLRYTTVENLCNLVRRQTGCEWSYSREGLAFGDVAEIAVAPIRVRRLSPEALAGVVDGMGNGCKLVSIDESSHLIMGERRSLRRLQEAIADADAGDAVTWAVQLYLVSISRTASKDLGLDIVPAVQLAAVSAAGPTSAVTAASGLTGSAQLQTLLRATSNRSGVELLADPLLLVRDGESVSMTRGLRIPVRTNKVTNQTGTTITQGTIQMFQTGLELNVKAKEIGTSKVRLDVKIESSDVAAITDGVPSTTAETLDTRCDVESGGVYLVGSLRRESGRRDITQLIQFGNVTKRDGSVMQVWVRAFRIRLDDHDHSRDGSYASPAGKASRRSATN
jgi:hypothetical protein